MPDNRTHRPQSSAPEKEQGGIDVENAKGDELHKLDVLFTSSGAATDVHLNRVVSPEFLYCEGYLKAARVLANHALANEFDRGILFFPIAFLYRHHIELSLKDLIQTAHTVASGQQGSPEGHVLADLWEQLKKVLWRLDESPRRNDLEAVEAYIRQMEQVDKRGQAFRYATSTEGKPHLREFNLLDIRGFSEAMERLASYLSGISFRLNLLLDRREEMMGYKQEFGTDS